MDNDLESHTLHAKKSEIPALVDPEKLRLQKIALLITESPNQHSLTCRSLSCSEEYVDIINTSLTAILQIRLSTASWWFLKDL